MRAIGYQTPASIDQPTALVDIELPSPEPGPHDLLVQIRAISVNPVDAKVRASASPRLGEWKVLGWDAAGKVIAKGERVTRFNVGDEVFYAGDLTRQGTNAELHLVDERIVGHKPKSLGWAEAAALPLTAITAWETLFERLDVRRAVPGASSILIIGGAGGVGSIAIQLARRLTDLTVLATASRPDSIEWAKALGAHHVLDHKQPLAAQLEARKLDAPGFVFATTHTDQYLTAIGELIAPQGRFAVIDDPEQLDILPFKRKSVSVHWEFMFTRSMFKTTDLQEQGALLDKLAQLVDDGTVRTTLCQHFGAIDSANLRRAHALIESGTSRGKVVLEGF